MVKKSVVMVKKGVGTVTLILTSEDEPMFISAKEIRMSDKDVLNTTYKQFQADGYVLKPEKEEKKVEAPASPKEKRPTKQYPDGFKWDTKQYYRIAREHGYSFCMPSGKIVVKKQYRDAIYQMMADENNAKNH